MTRIVLSLTLALGTSQLATGQQPAVDQDELKKLQAEVKTLRLQVEKLQALLKREVRQPTAGDGTGHLLVIPGVGSSGGVSFTKAAVITLTAKDAEAIGRDLPQDRTLAGVQCCRRESRHRAESGFCQRRCRKDDRTLESCMKESRGASLNVGAFGGHG